MAIKIRNIIKKFPSKDSGEFITVLDNIDMEVPKGKVVALYGPNGCGKTTIRVLSAGVRDRFRAVVL